MFETLLLSITSYIGTNIDDMIINTFFFAFAGGKREIRSIVLGKYVGIGILILISVVGSMGLKWLPTEYLRYLGFIPIGLGVKEWVCGKDDDDDDDLCVNGYGATNLLWNVAVVTIANGADNIGVYVPLFTGFIGKQYLIFVVVFLIMTAIWCALGYRASKITVYERMISRYKQIIVPAVYILLGIYILIF